MAMGITSLQPQSTQVIWVPVYACSGMTSMTFRRNYQLFYCGERAYYRLIDQSRAAAQKCTKHNNVQEASIRLTFKELTSCV